MNIVHVWSDGWNEFNSSRWRGLNLNRPLRVVGHHLVDAHIDQWFKNTPEIRRACSIADLIIVQRVMVEEALERVKFWREHHKPIVVDADDPYQLLVDQATTGNQASKFWYEGKVDVHTSLGVSYEKKLDRHPMEQFIAGCRMITGMSMPSRILMQDWQQYAHCWYIPNFIDSEHYLPFRRTPERRRKTDEPLVLGYGSSMSHLPSFRDSGVLEALRRVFLQRKNVQYLHCGDERIMPMLPIADSRKLYQPYVTWEVWPKVMSRFDLTLAPMCGRYDDSRSAIKLTEATLMGVPIVASRSPAYQDFVEAGIGVYTSDSGKDKEGIDKRAAEWEVALLDMIDHYDDHRDRIHSRFDYVLEHYDATLNVHYVESQYRDMIEAG